MLRCHTRLEPTWRIWPASQGCRPCLPKVGRAPARTGHGALENPRHMIGQSHQNLFGASQNRNRLCVVPSAIACWAPFYSGVVKINAHALGTRHRRLWGCAPSAPSSAPSSKRPPLPRGNNADRGRVDLRRQNKRALSSRAKNNPASAL